MARRVLDSAGLNGRVHRAAGGVLAALIATAGAAAQELPARCPIDGAALRLAAGGTWNAAGGEDSDGCTWAVDAAGRWRVVGLDEVVSCARCKSAWRGQDLGLRLGPAEERAITAALASVASSSIPLAERHERAAACYRALPPALRPAPWLEAEMLLRAAWAARSEAVLADPAGGDPDPLYRPRDPGEALDALRALEARLGQGGRPSHIEVMLVLLEQVREELGHCAPASTLAALARERAAHGLSRLEQELFALRADLPPEVARRAQGEQLLALARAATRLGDPAARERWLRLGETRLGERLTARVQAVRQACAEEARLLGLAGQALLQAAEGETDPRQRARLLYLGGDCARRRGDPRAARAALSQVQPLYPEGRPAQWAAVLLRGLE